MLQYLPPTFTRLRNLKELGLINLYLYIYAYGDIHFAFITYVPNISDRSIEEQTVFISIRVS